MDNVDDRRLRPLLEELFTDKKFMDNLIKKMNEEEHVGTSGQFF